MKAKIIKYLNTYPVEGKMLPLHFLLLFIALAFWGYSTAAFCGESVSYDYDTRGRLINAYQNSGHSFHYGYDAAGNIVTFQQSAQTDSDGDFLPDSRGNASSCPYIDDADSDDDGIPDGLEDRNQDGAIDSNETNPCNPDTDGDGIQDGTELGYTEPVPDPDGAGPLKGTDTGVFQPDLEPGSTTNPLLKDTDNDGVDDGTEDADHNGRVDAGESNPAIVLSKSISGTLYEAGGTTFATPIVVKAYSGSSCNDLELEATTWSDADTGAYVFENLSNDGYYIFAEPSGTDVLGEWYSTAGDAYDCNHAERISLSSVSEAAGKDIYLNQAASIAGSVLENGGAVPAEAGNIYVKVYAQNACTGPVVKSVSLNPADGHFSVEGLSAGTYFVRADPGASGYQPEWWATGEDAYLCSTAEPIVVAFGAQIDTVEIRLDKGSRISGTVYKSDGTTAVTGETIVIEAYADDACAGNPYVSALINETTGAYTIAGLKPGTYFLKAKDLETSHIEEWWSETGNAFNCLQAGTIAVATQTDKTGIDFQLDTGGVISGTVFEADGETPVATPLVIEFYLYESTSYRACSVPLVTYTNQAADGSYSQSLPAGRYYMRINPTGTDYAFAWWTGTGGNLSCQGANDVTVQAGVMASGKNFKLQPSSVISGHIYQSDGVTPVAGALQVIAYSDDPCDLREVKRGAYDSATGQYLIGNLGNGGYTVFVNAEGTSYADEWWSSDGNAYFCFQANHMYVEDNQDVTDQDILLDVGGAVSGTVYQKDGVTPVDQAVPIGIYPENACGSYRKAMTATSDPATGQYVFSRQGPGSYTLRADPDSSNIYLDEWWSESGDAFDCQDADVFSVVSGSAQSGKDFSLDVKTTISGTIYKPDGATMNMLIYVYLYPDNPCQGSSIDYTYSSTSNGTFSFQGLKPGRYHIFADARYNIYASEWWSQSGNAFTCAEALEIVISSGEDITNLEIHMDVGAKISGTLYQEDGTTPVPESTRVRLYRGDPCNPEYVTYDYTSAGFFEIDALPPGAYYLLTEATYYYNQWWSPTWDAQNCEQAQPITFAYVGDVAETTDFRLKAKGSISGHVYQLDGETRVEGSMGVYLYKKNPPCNTSYYTYVYVSSDGSYTFRGLDAGTYFIRAYYEYSDYMSEWWSTEGDTFDCDEAEAIVLTEGQQVDAIDFSLHIKGGISGKILKIDGSPIDSESMYVNYYVGESACTATYKGGTAASSTDGSYTISRLAPGTYFLKSRAYYMDNSAYIPEWWSESGHILDCDQAEGIQVVLDQSVADKDFHLYDCTNFPNKAANDNFDQAIVLAGAKGSQSTNNFCASAQDGEPDHAGYDEGAKSSLWWRWTSTSTGSVIFNTEKSSFDTVLAVYTGGAVDALSLVAQNDDDGNELWSRLSFVAEAGQTYAIAVDAYDGIPGTMVLTYQKIQVLAGDVNGDEFIDLSDAILALQTLTKFTSGSIPYIEGDVNADGRIGIADAVFILQKLAETR
ncbi:MAG: hypothetical protein JXA41_07840 [Deltaproteobacteria bacterium]|nr:hypothetical protein [Deltaproteobacteria bacterium]